MSNVNLEVYLFFKGNCREAMEFYKSIFGGKLEISTVGDSPDVPGMPDLDKNWVMHSTLQGGDIKLMASDTPTASDKAAKVELSLGGTDDARLRQIFDALAAGGKVKMPLEKQFWGDTFGMLSDKFGIDWNMNIGDNMNSGNNA
jgi:PhnB protein